MKTLKQHNAERSKAYDQWPFAKTNVPNGISCPECGVAELVDDDPSVTLTSYPPQKRVHCPECGWAGFRYA